VLLTFHDPAVGLTLVFVNSTSADWSRFSCSYISNSSSFLNKLYLLN